MRTHLQAACLSASRHAGFRSRQSSRYADSHALSSCPLANAALRRRASAVQRSNTAATLSPTAPGEALDALAIVNPSQARIVEAPIPHRNRRARYTWDLALQEVQVLNGGQVRLVREHALGFRDLAPGPIGAMAGNDAAEQGAKKVIDAIGGLFKKKKP